MDARVPRIRVAGSSLAVLAAMVLAPSGAQAQESDFFFEAPRITLSFHLGLNRAAANSQVYEFTQEFLTVEERDFDSPTFRGELGVRVTPRFDLALDFGVARGSVTSESRDFVGTDDLPIIQETTLTQVPITFSGKYYLKDRGRSVGQFAWIPGGWTPYVGAGVGIVSYDFVQSGEFVVEPSLEIIRDRLASSATGGLAQLLAGVEVPLGLHVMAVFDGRYRWASAAMRSDWIAFDDIDLSGFSATAGIAFRF